MTTSQVMAAVELLPMLEEQAKKRQIEAGKKFGRGIDGSKKVVQKIAQAIPEKKSRDIAAKLTGTNHSQSKLIVFVLYCFWSRFGLFLRC